MGNWKSVPRKKRKHPLIDECSEIFSEAVKEGDYETAGIITLYCVLKLFAKKGIMTAIHDANSFIKRKKLRGGL